METKKFARRSSAFEAIKSIFAQLNDYSEVTNQTYGEKDVTRVKLMNLTEMNEYYNSLCDTLSTSIKKKARLEFFTTPEGQALKESIENRLSEISEAIDNEDASYTEAINDLLTTVSPLLKLRYASKYRMEVGIYDSAANRYIFGQEMSIIYNAPGSWEYENRNCAIEMNLGTTGSFDIEDNRDFSRANFYIIVGNMLSNIDFRYQLECLMSGHYNVISILNHEASELQFKLRNPKTA